MENNKILIVVGARPNFMKAAPLLREFKKYPKFNPILVHTGQHYDVNMSRAFFEDLDMPEPHIYLGVGSGTHAAQTGRIMIAFENVCFKEEPGMVVVVGDINSTLACALVAAKLHILVAHVESGLRSHDRTMPEEINRILTDQVSDLLFTSCEEADRNLIREGIPKEKIFFVGNVMIDTLVQSYPLVRKSEILGRLGLLKKMEPMPYALVTLHRPSNVDDRSVLGRLVETLMDLNRRIPIVFPAHPRTLEQMKRFNFNERIFCPEKGSSLGSIGSGRKISVIPPVGYVDFLCLMSKAKLVLTDSGGIQEETTFLRIPCLTLRENTERPVTITQGTNILVGTDPPKIQEEAMSVLKNGMKKAGIPRYWDGNAAKRVVKILAAHGF